MLKSFKNELVHLAIEGTKRYKEDSSLKKSLVAKHNFGMTVDYPESKFCHRYFTMNFIKILGRCVEENTWLSVSQYKNHQSFGLG